jgi:isocitrate dehydrogenase
LFHKVFDEIAAEYNELQNEHMVVDIGAARLADTPEMFDVIVTANLYGDIISDIAAQIAGSVGMAPSANIGEHGAMFEAIHGSALQIAGQNVANPSGLLLSAVMMLNHVGQPEVAQTVHNAWLRTLEDGVHTQGIFKESSSTRRVGTKGFTNAVIERLGELPRTVKSVSYNRYGQESEFATMLTPVERRAPAKKDLVGVDIFLH